VAERLTTIDQGIKEIQTTKESTTDFQENMLKVNTDIQELNGFKNIMESKNHQIDADLGRADTRLRRLEEKSGISHVDEEPQIKSVREAVRRASETPPSTPPRPQRPQSANAASRSPGAAGGSPGLTRRNRPTTAASTSLQPPPTTERKPENRP
jgi:TolA-binding protein